MFKITKTEIPDYNDNIDIEKISLATKLQQIIYPLIDEQYIKKEKDYEVLIENREFLKETFILKKKELLKLDEELKHITKVKLLMQRIKSISDLNIRDKDLKHELLILSKVALDLDDNKLDYHIVECVKILSQLAIN